MPQNGLYKFRVPALKKRWRTSALGCRSSEAASLRNSLLNQRRERARGRGGCHTPSSRSTDRKGEVAATSRQTLNSEHRHPALNPRPGKRGEARRAKKRVKGAAKHSIPSRTRTSRQRWKAAAKLCQGTNGTPKTQLVLSHHGRRGRGSRSTAHRPTP